VRRVADTMDSSPHLRRRDGNVQRATTFELFFDLVFVFAITQVSHHLIEHLTWVGVGQSAFMLLMVWWAWIYTTWMTNWFDPDSAHVRLLLVAVMGLSLLMAVSLPDAFGDRALLFAGSYVALQVVRNGFNVWAVTNGSTMHRSFIRILVHSMVAGSAWLAGALVGGEWLVPIWIGAMVLEYLGPFLGYWLPRLGSTRTADWMIHGGHFAERFQLLVIIALGESIVVTGATAADTDLSTAAIGGIMIAFLTTAALWWLYFNFVAERAVHRMETARDPGRLARNAFTYMHLPIVMGIILSAVSDELLVAHPGDPYEHPVLAVAGPVLYLVGHNLFRLSMTRTFSVDRLVATAVLLLLWPLARSQSAAVMSLLVLVVLVALIVREQFVDVEPAAAAEEPAVAG
jgi:low temperature requirement protein LtrA